MTEKEGKKKRRAIVAGQWHASGSVCPQKAEEAHWTGEKTAPTTLYALPDRATHGIQKDAPHEQLDLITVFPPHGLLQSVGEDVSSRFLAYPDVAEVELPTVQALFDDQKTK